MPTVTANGINIFYEISGEGEPLVLIAGLATDLTQYDWMVRELAENNTVIAFDNRGVGRSDKPDLPYSIELMADDMAAPRGTRCQVIAFNGGHLFAFFKRKQFLNAVEAFLESQRS